jgi:hypothetical protein
LTVALLSLVASVALFAAARYPRAATVVGFACGTAACAADYLPTPLLLAPLIGCLYRLTVLVSQKAAAWWTGFAVGAVILGGLMGDPTPTGGSLILRTAGVALWLLPAVFAGRMTRAQRAYLRMVQARAEDAERGRDDEIRHRRRVSTSFPSWSRPAGRREPTSPCGPTAHPGRCPRWSSSRRSASSRRP